MRKNKYVSLAFFLAALFLLVTIQFRAAAAQTNEELQREIEQQKQRNELLRQLKALEDEEKAIQSGRTTTPANANSSGGAGAATPTPTPAPAPTPADVLPPIQRLTNPFDPNGTGQYTACQLQALEEKNFNRYERSFCFLAEKLVRNARDANLNAISFETGEIQDEMFIILLSKLAGLPQSEAEFSKDLKDFALAIENKRTDKQIGADAKGAGTTSLATRGGIPRFLSWAVENGGITGAKDGNTLTFRVNPVGFAESLSGASPLDLLVPTRRSPALARPADSRQQEDDQFTRELRKFSVGFSFDITRGADAPVFIGNRQQLSAVSFKYNFLNRKDPLHPIYAADWKKFNDTFNKDFVAAAKTLDEEIVCQVGETLCTPREFRNKALEAWRVATEKELKKIKITAQADDAELVERLRVILVAQVDALPLDKLRADSVVVNAINEIGNVRLKYSQGKKALQEKIAKGAVMSLEYTNYREVNAPDLSNFRFVVEKGLVAGWNFTGNASVSIYNKKPAVATTKRVRDFDLTLQLEKIFKLFGSNNDTVDQTPFSSGIRLGNPVFSFSGQYQRLPGDIAALDGLVKPNTKGDIAVGQFKLVIPIDNLGIKLPFSVSFANRSELIKESTVRGNFGFTFDLDRLLLGNLFKSP